jgi:prophage antirepressor-like protein
MELSAFKTPEALGSLNIRVVQIDGNPWFVAADVCRALGLRMTGGVSYHLRHLRKDEKGRT